MRKCKSKKLKTARISVTLPQIMIEDFKAKNEMTGLSISRLIYLRLKSRKAVIIASEELLREVKYLQQKFAEIVATGTIEEESMNLLRQQVLLYSAASGVDQEVRSCIINKR